MRIRIGAHVLLLMLAVTGSSVRAEPLPWIIPINSSFRVGYLYGSQVVSTSSDYGSHVYDYDVLLDISFGSPVLSGTIELSPFPLSGPWPTYSLMLSYVEIDPTTGQKWTEAGRYCRFRR